MFGSKFDEIMKSQPSGLNVYEEMAIMQAKVNTTNLLLRGLHHGGKEKDFKKTSQS